jgi:hypothetical protein
MIETFKVLTYLGQYVDENLSNEVIYTTSIPQLKSKDVTIEQIVERCKQMQDMAGVCFITEAYIDNLKKCELIDVQVTKLN